MDADMFCKWLEEMMLPALAERDMEGIFVMDNASYHCTPAEGSINVASFTKKAQVTDLLDKYTPPGTPLPYRPGRAPIGDSLEQLKAILTDWLKVNAEKHGLLVDKTRVSEMLRMSGHRLLYTPPYHPELQPIETLWRDVKMRIARKFSRQRTMAALYEEIIDAFGKYGTAKNCKSKIDLAEAFELDYVKHGLYGSKPIELDDEDEDEDGPDINDSDVGESSADESEEGD